MTTPITFPNLHLEITVSRVAFTVFGKDIYWYGIIIACAIILASVYVCRRADQFGTTADDLLDMIIWAVPIGVCCARAYYVIFNWHVDGFDENPIRMFYIWEGGLAIYGGIIGGAIAVILVALHKKIPVGVFLDLCGLGLPMAQAMGRWGNFFNQEAHGCVTDTFFKMGLVNAAGEVIYYHPTFFYESVWNIIGFVLLHFYSKKRKFDGEVFALYVAWYGLGRSFIEGLRTDSLYIGASGIRVSQLVGVVSCTFAVAFEIYMRWIRKANRLYVTEKTAMEAQTEESAAEETATIEKDSDKENGGAV